MMGFSRHLFSLMEIYGKLIDQLRYDSVRLADPEFVGPLIANRIRTLIIVLEAFAIASSITAAVIVFFSTFHAVIFLLLSIVLIILYHIVPYAWRSVLSSGLEQELPAVLVYLVPYSANPRYIADVIAGLPEGVFRWFKHESARLKLILDMGYDPLTALRLLASSTPSRRFREVLVEYTSLQFLGSPSSEASIRLLDRAVNLVRDKWLGYREAGRAIVELSAGGLVSLVALSPLIGEGVGAVAMGMGLLLVVSGALLLFMRPHLGDLQSSPAAPAVFFASIAAASMLALSGMITISLVVLALAAVVGEILHYRAVRVYRSALRSLRVAAEKARLGLDYTGDLARALPLGHAIRAVLWSSRIAGSIGVGQALLRLLRVVEEAEEHRRRASMEGAILEVISMATPLVMAIALTRLAKIFSGAGGFMGIQLISLEPVVALAPLAVVPAVVLRRGRTSSALSSLGAMLLVLLLGLPSP